MLKILLLATFIVSTNAFCEEGQKMDFEAELRALETNQLKTEELQMRNADAVTDLFTDEVATGQAAVMRNETSDSSTIIAPEEVTRPKVRRIRSR
jgi:hypothetical protein